MTLASKSRLQSPSLLNSLNSCDPDDGRPSSLLIEEQISPRHEKAQAHKSLSPNGLKILGHDGKHGLIFGRNSARVFTFHRTTPYQFLGGSSQWSCGRRWNCG